MPRLPRSPRLAAAALLAGAFVAGLTVDHVAAASRAPVRPYRALDVFAEVLAHVENSWVGEPDERELVYGAIDGLMARLDPHSVFLRPEVNQQLRDETAGAFDGLGIEVTRVDGAVTVISPMADSPGERAGILPGDRILSIDGASTRDLSLDEATRRMKGPIGSKAVLEVMRDGFRAPQALTLVRARVRVASVEWRVLDARRRLVYLRVKSFQERTEPALRRALADARAQLGAELRGLVLDLRNDPGGLLDQAVRVSDVFLREGIIVSTEGRGGRNVEVERARERDTEPDYPIVVLVNKGTASASEIVAGALQDHRRAVILGTQTFGKGSVQTIIDLDDGSGLKLTVARYFTPSHRSIQDLGITPDQVVPDDVAPAGGTARAAPPPSPAVAVGSGERVPALDGDPQLRAALARLAASAALEPPAGAGSGDRGTGAQVGH